MPYLLQKNVIVDGPSKAVIHLIITSDGSGELVNAPLIDTRNDIYPIGRPTETTLTQLWWSNSYFDATLLKEDTVPVPIWVMTVNGQYADFRSFGGIKVPVDLDGNGNILISTLGFGPAGSMGSLVIELKKN